MLHEAIYAPGKATRWACHRIHEERYARFDDHDNFLFFGEMIFAWTFDEIGELRSLKSVA